MSILENLYLAYGGSGKWLSFISEKEKKFLRDKIASLGMGLENKMNQAVGLLSGGQRQALTLAMAIIVPPKLLLLDEHTAALDPPTSEKVMRITDDVIKNNLQVADQSAFVLARDYNMPLYVFDFNEKDAITRICNGEEIGTYIGKDCKTELY